MEETQRGEDRDRCVYVDRFPREKMTKGTGAEVSPFLELLFGLNHSCEGQNK